MAQDAGLTIMGTEVNIGIGKAITNLILEVKTPYVLFLEKDWEVVEQLDVIKQQMEMGIDLLQSKVNGSRADAIKYRSRLNAGYPNIDRGLCEPPHFDEIDPQPVLY